MLFYRSNEKFITQRVEEFVATDPASAMTSKDQLKQSLRHELHITASQTKNHKKPSYIIQPGEVPADAPAYVPKQPKQRSQDIVDFMVCWDQLQMSCVVSIGVQFLICLQFTVTVSKTSGE